MRFESTLMVALICGLFMPGLASAEESTDGIPAKAPGDCKRNR